MPSSADMRRQIKNAGFALTGPCNNCPFRTDVPVFLHLERAKQIAAALRDSGSFHCHKTTTHDDEGEVEVTGREQQCAGSLILQENDGDPGQVIRIARFLNLYDPGRLDLEAPVYDSITEWVQAHHPERDDDEVEYEHCGVVAEDCEDPAGYSDGGGVHENDDPPTCNPDEGCQYCGNPMCSACRADKDTCVYCAEAEEWTEPSHRVQVSYRMIDHLQGSQLWHDLAAGRAPRSAEPAAAVSMMRRVQRAKARADGSVTVELTVSQLSELKDYAEALQASTMGSSDRDILADYNAANGMLRRIDKVMR